MMRKLWMMTTLLLLSGCSILQPVKPLPMQTYLISDPITKVSSIASSQGPTIMVALPTAPQWLSSTQMVYQLSPNQISYFGENQWAAPPAELLQPLIVHALQQSGRYRAVMSAPFAGTTDLRLDIKLIQMQQLFWQSPSQYRVTLQLQLINGATDQALAAQRLSSTVVASAATPEAGVTAANQAIAQLLPQIVNFCKRYSG